MLRRLRLAVGAGACLGLLGLVAPGLEPVAAAPALVVNDLNHGRTPQDLANALAGSGVSVSNVTFTGANNAAGTFTGGGGVVGFDAGVVLGTGSVQSDATAGVKGVEGPNESDSTTTQNGLPGDSQLTTLAGFPTFDATVLQFDFVPQFGTLQFSYVFSSDEYNEFANSDFNDVFAFYVNGQNCALVPNTSEPVSVNTINGGNPFGTDAHHPDLYRNNSIDDPGPPTIDTEMDGLTTTLPCNALVNANQTNHMKLAIADGSDFRLDSNVFLRADSLVSGTAVTTQLSGGDVSGAQITVPANTAVTDAATLSGVTASSATGTVTYRVYSNSNCATQFATAGTKTVTGGVVPDSDPVVMPAPGPFYWRAFYSGDGTHNASSSACGDEIVFVQSQATFDLSVTSDAQPENVLPAGDVRFRNVVTNEGPGVAPNVAFVDTIPAFTLFEQAITTKGGCSGVDPNRHIVCLIGALDPGESVTIDVTVGAPTNVGARLVNTAHVVSHPADASSENNTVTSVSTVQPQTHDSASGFVPPGGTITTGAHATRSDNTVSGLTLPNTGDGANITLTEKSGLHICGGQLCIGQAVALKRFPGYDDYNNPPILRIQWDHSLGLGKNSVIWLQKGSTVTVLPRCNSTHVHPCLLSFRRLTEETAKDKEDVGDIVARILVLGDDPRWAIR